MSEARLEAHQRANQDDDSLTFFSPDSDFITIAWTNLRFSSPLEIYARKVTTLTRRGGEPKHHTFSLAFMSLQQVSSHLECLWHGSLMKPSCRRCREWKEMSSVIGLNGLWCFGFCDVISEGFESMLWLAMSEIDFCFVARDEWLLLTAQRWRSILLNENLMEVENFDWKLCVCDNGMLEIDNCWQV